MRRYFDIRLAVGLGLVAAMIVASAMLAYWNIYRLDQDAERVAHTREVLDLTNDALLTLVDAETGVRGFVISNRDEFLQPYRAATNRLDRLITALHEKTAEDSGQQARVNRFIGMANEYMDDLKRIVPMPHKNKEERTALLLAAEKAKAQMDKTRALVTDIEQSERASLQQRQVRTRRTYTLAEASTALAGALGLLMVAAYYGLLRRSLAVRDEAAARLREADRRKDEFVATLAHELRNPLAPLRSSLEILRLAGDDLPLREQSLGTMERQLAQIVRLVDDLLDVARISRGKLTLRKERIDLAAAVHSAVETVRPYIDASAHELTVTLPPEPIDLHADPVRLAQVIANLLSNAAKYTDKGGRIWLTVERHAGEAIVSVRDTGIGIAAAHLPRIFQMFAQVESALERTQGGLGIGLALVRGLVALHGGRIEARSKGPGLGSEFIIHLPIMEHPCAAPVTARDSEQPPMRPKRRVLVVDDNRDAANSLALMLRMRGHEVNTAHDGVEAVKAAAAFQPEVVLLDIGMPGMNGYEAARHIREQTWGQEMVLIALTGWGQEEVKRQAAEAGFNHHLTKPVEPAALATLLATSGRAVPA